MAYTDNNVLIYTALRNHIEANKGSLVVAYEGEAFNPPRDGRFFVVTNTSDNPIRLAWSDNCPVDRGGVLIMSARIPVALGHNTIPQMGYAAEVSRIFPMGTVIRFGGIDVKVVNQPALVSQPYFDGTNSYIHYPMSVRWRSFC